MRKLLHIGKENIVYLIIWLGLFATPLVSLVIRTQQQGGGTFHWGELMMTWGVFAALLVAFLIHNILLMPMLLTPRRRWRYFVCTGLLVLAFATWQLATADRHRGPMPREMQQQMQQAPRKPEGGQEPRMTPKSRKPEQRPAGRMTPPPPVLFGGREMFNIVLLLGVLAMNIGVKLYFRSQRREEEMRELQSENLQTQLEYLKYQVNPHFFMNTLNNIHALVDIDPEMAKEAIVELSKMMRYILYEGNRPMVPLQSEAQFLQSYLQLMRLRFTDKVDIRCDLPQPVPEAQVPPLLLITFVENAFKHGISYSQPSFVHIAVTVADGRLRFSCQNSKHAATTDEHGGVGLQNARRRLALIYADRYTLDIRDEATTYSVDLSLPLNIENRKLKTDN